MGPSIDVVGVNRGIMEELFTYTTEDFAKDHGQCGGRHVSCHDCELGSILYIEWHTTCVLKMVGVNEHLMTNSCKDTLDDKTLRSILWPTHSTK